VGFVELGLTGVLLAFGASNAEAVAGTMIYRLLRADRNQVVVTRARLPGR